MSKIQVRLNGGHIPYLSSVTPWAVLPSDVILVSSCLNLYGLIRYNSILECFPNEPLSGRGMGFQTSILQSLTFLRTIPLLLQYELVNKSTNKSRLRRHIGLPRISESQANRKVVSTTSRLSFSPVLIRQHRGKTHCAWAQNLTSGHLFICGLVNKPIA